MTPPAAARNSGNLYTLLVSVSTLLVFIVVILSAWLRLSGSGLGCADWPSCYALLDTATHGVEALAGAHLVPPWATLTHRVVASLLGVLVFGIAFLAWRHRRQPGHSFPVALAVLLLTVFLSVLGYETPSPLWPWVTLGNLLGGMAMLALLWWLGQRSASRATPAVTRPALRPWALAGIAVVFLQIALGGWVSANFAALACTEIPGCGGYPWTEGPWRAGFDLLRVLPVTEGGVVITGDAGKIIHLTHRAAALLTLLYLGWLGGRAIAAGNPYRGTGVALLALLALQILLGAGAVAFGLPLWLVTLHNAVAALLLLAAVNLYHLLTPPKTH